jgi:predicted transcriptional regulator
MPNTSVRLDDDSTARLDRIAEKLTARTPGAKMRRSDAIRVALERGMAALEGELGIARPKKPKR